MKLFIYNDYNTSTKEFNPGATPKEPIIWALTSPGIDYSEITDIEIIDVYVRLAKDYKVGRDRIKQLVIDLDPDEATAFNMLTASQKVVAAKHKIGTEAQRNTTLGVEGNYLAMISYRAKTTEARQVRALMADVLLQNELPDHKIAVMNIAKEPFNNYIEFGIEGYQSNDTISGIRDYIDANNGYSSTGLRAQTYVPLNMSLDALCDKLIDQLVHGIY